jgi:hypothetical protein
MIGYIDLLHLRSIGASGTSFIRVRREGESRFEGVVKNLLIAVEQRGRTDIGMFCCILLSSSIKPEELSFEVLMLDFLWLLSSL